MKGLEVHAVLSRKRITTLHHANTVATSCTFLELGGLASRGFVASGNMSQTPQYSDTDDRKYGIWHDIFMDTADIHDRARRPNDYGPVLFVLGTAVLRNLPASTEVVVSRINPVHWTDADTPQDRYFLTLEELDAGLQLGTFGQHIIVKNTDLLLFGKALNEILLDDPHRALGPKTDAFTHACGRLDAVNATDVPITKRECREGCACIDRYGTLPESRVPNFNQRFR